MAILLESKRTLHLALPMIIGQMSQMLLGVADTVMVGKLGVTELATLTFVNSIFLLPFLFGIGILTSITVHSSHASGADEPQVARSSCRNGLYISVALAVAFIVLGLLLSPTLSQFGQPREVVDLARPFLMILFISLLPGLASIALKNHSDALSRPWPAFWIFLAGVLLNIALNAIFIYGKFGVPAMGMIGAAWATLASRIIIFVAMLLWFSYDHSLKNWVPQHWWHKPRRADIIAHAKIGIPTSFQMLSEAAAFSAAGLIMGHFGKIAMAAHQIAFACAGTAFMVPLGLSMALTVRAGEVFGSQQVHQLRTVIYSGWIMAGFFGLCNASAFFFFGPELAALFTADEAVIKLTSALLVIVGVFQLFDGLQVASSSMLRGLHDTRIPALLGFVAYWLVGLPFALYLSWHGAMAARGVWWGLAMGLFVAFAALGPRLLHRLRRLEMPSAPQ